MKFLSLHLLSLLALATTVTAQETSMNAAQLAHALDRLSHTGRVLYVAAHPDDENTRLLAYLTNGRHLTAAYLSLTRGGGGQNLIGSEQDALLDVIRTEELLAARRIDGAVQRFSRMRDFGYSKTADETLRIWGHEEALADVVWVIRTFQPDVIVARFDEKPPNHGHHTASAILIREAFAAAADASRFPDQLRDGVHPWQAVRLVLNVPTWREGPPPADALVLDAGGYDPRFGLSFGEISALSRSQHKSQGFGVPGDRGPLIERFLPVAGSEPKKDILDGVDITWSRYGKRAAPLIAALKEARRKLDRDRPEAALPALAKAHAALAKLPDEPRVRDARRILDEIIASAAGLFVRATAAQPGAVPGSRVPLEVEIVQRRPASMKVRRLTFSDGTSSDDTIDLSSGEKKKITREVSIPADAPISTPYWLTHRQRSGRQEVVDAKLVGDPSGPPPLAVDVEIAFGRRTLHLEVPVSYAWTDRVHGERIRLFRIVPPATLTPSRQAVMLPNGDRATVVIRVRAGRDELRGEVSLPAPAGWTVEPAQIPVALKKAGDETAVRFDVTAPDDASAVEVTPVIDVDGRSWSYREDVIDYPHIPMQVVLQSAHLRLVPVALRLPRGPVGYIAGSGDTIADDLTHVGLPVVVLDDETLRSGDLGSYRSIVVGIRAYNTRQALRGAHERLMKYVESGGTVVVQYNTSNRWDPLDTPIGPYPIEIGRDRVTDETAAMEAIDAEDSLLLEPNRIGAADFEGWVQERGLYYAVKWDDRYRAIFRSADPGEQPLTGGTLVAKHGRGRYVYTGLAFFRQLPAGVPGAYRLFANLLAAN